MVVNDRRTRGSGDKLRTVKFSVDVEGKLMEKSVKH